MKPQSLDDVLATYREHGHRHYGDRMPAISAHHVTGTMDAPQVIEIPYTLTDAGSDPAKRRFAFREIGTGSSAAVRKLFDEGVKSNGIGPELAIWVDWIEIERAIPASSDVTAGITALQPLLDTQNADAIPPEKARRAVEQFIAEAYRGVKPAKGEVERLAAILQHVHGWTAKTEISVDVYQKISVLTALEEARARVIEGQAVEVEIEDKQPRKQMIHVEPNATAHL